MSELKIFAGLDQALARLCLRDSRSRKEIAEAAKINASMLSGYCSGRLVPSIEHLDRLLTTLGVGVEELTYELRAVDFRSQNAPLVVSPRFPGSREGEATVALLTGLLQEIRTLLRDRRSELPGPTAEPETPPAEATRGQRGGRKGPGTEGTEGIEG